MTATKAGHTAGPWTAHAKSATPGMNGPEKKATVLESYEMGEIGEVEFFELALDAGCSLEEIGEILTISRCGLADEEE